MSILGEASCAYRPDYPQPGWAEQSPSLWEDALAPTIAHALDAAGMAAGAVRALGIAGQLDGCIATNAAGEALAPCLIWMDRRATREAEVMDADALRALTGVTRDASHMAAKIRWLMRHNPEMCGSVTTFHQPVSYLVSRLTGEAVFDHSLASTSMLYALDARDYSPALLQAFEIDRASLPAISNADSPAGHLTAEGAALSGLPEGLCVAVGTGDDFSSALGAGIVDPGRLVCVLGTAEVVGALMTEAHIDGAGLVETHSFPGGNFYMENPGWLSGGAVEWSRELFGLADAATFDGRAAEVAPGAEGVSFLPALSGAMAPEWVASARACFYGLTPAHGVPHMARAVLEGCAFAMRDVAVRLDEMGAELQAIRLLGGGAASRLWAGIRADSSGLPVEVPLVTDTSPVGAAVCAAVAGGVQEDLAACAKLIGTVAKTIDPNPVHRAAYDDAYGAYRRLFNSLGPMFN